MALVGVDGHLVEVEADIASGLPATILVGLPDTALREARDRIRAAIVNSGESWPGSKITVGLSPATLPKRGSGFDLAIAVAILAAAEAVPADAPRREDVPRRTRAGRAAAPGARRAARGGRGRGGRGHRGRRRAERRGGRPGARRRVVGATASPR